MKTSAKIVHQKTLPRHFPFQITLAVSLNQTVLINLGESQPQRIVNHALENMLIAITAHALRRKSNAEMAIEQKI